MNPVPIQTTRVREIRAWEMKLEGKSNEAIAKELGVDRSTVSKMLTRVQKRETARLRERLDAERMRTQERLQEIWGEAMEAWERSKQAREVSRARTGPRGKSVCKEVASRDGDPRVLAMAMK